jgi:prepilin-type N-terminal cleavage/methylation domain-containing protein
VEQVMLHGFWQSERGFTLIEVMIPIIIMMILFSAGVSVWLGAVESRKVDSATNQLVADLRLAHTNATNRLANHEVRLTDNSPTYRIGRPPAALDTYTTYTLPANTRVDTPTATLNIVFTPNGSVTPSGAPITLIVSTADGDPTDPSHTIEVNRITSRVEVDG